MDDSDHQGVTAKLEELGLKAHEGKIYLAVLRLGETSAGAIISEVKLHREQVYRALRELVAEGFLTEAEKNGVSHFSAIDPTVFVNRSKTKLALAQSLLPYLSSIKKSKTQIIQVWEGEEAIKKQLEDIVNTLKIGEEYLVLGGVGELYFEAAKKYLPIFTPQFRKKNIKARIIAYKGYEYPAGGPLGSDNISIKTIDRPFGTPATTAIYGDKYTIDLLDPDNIAIITIENKKVADSFRQTFEALWK